MGKTKKIVKKKPVKKRWKLMKIVEKSNKTIQKLLKSHFEAEKRWKSDKNITKNGNIGGKEV